MTNEKMAFSKWKTTADSVMKKIYGIDTNDAGIDDGWLSDRWSTGEAPEHFVEWFGAKYDLISKREMGIEDWW
jgi:hypothetical protein